MTDDSTPIELSWNWKTSGSPYPQVRYSIEPMSLSLDSDHVVERTRSALKFVYDVAAYLPLVNWEWFELLRYELTCVDRSISSSKCASGRYITQFFFAFDLKDDKDAGSETLKAYLVPSARARWEGCSNLDLVSRAVDRLTGNDAAMSAAYGQLTRYLNSMPPEAQPEVELVGFDCVSPPKSRLKVYVRTRMTSFDHIMDVLTLGYSSNLYPESFESSRSALKTLWESMLDMKPETLSSDIFMPNKERTGGILFYFELRPGSVAVQPKVYIPVRHLLTNDATVARGFGKFLGSCGLGFKSGVSYEDALQALW